MSIFSRSKLIKEVSTYGRIVQQDVCRQSKHNFSAAIEDVVKDRVVVVGRMCTKCGSCVRSRDLQAISEKK